MTPDTQARPDPDTLQPLIGQAPLMTMAFHGGDLAAVGRQLMDRVSVNPLDASALMDLATIAQLTGDRDNGMVFQRHALAISQHYRLAPPEEPAALRLLVLMGPGDFMANTPFDFLLEGSDVAVDLVYLGPGLPFPPVLPSHDVVFTAIAESDENQPLLTEVAALAATLDAPVINRPELIAGLSRDRACRTLAAIPGVEIPHSLRVDRATLEAIEHDCNQLSALIGGATFPIIVRPVGSHAGRGLVRIDGPGELGAYLRAHGQVRFFISPFVDFRSADGLFRKARIAVIDGQPHACHLAISDHWMIHYLNAGMLEDEAKRAEEALFMEEFETGFAARHAGALDEITRRLGLQYYGLDCAELPDGRLLIFEADSSMVVHAMDPEDRFPYKKVQMRKVFTAFRNLLATAAGPTAATGP